MGVNGLTSFLKANYTTTFGNTISFPLEGRVIVDGNSLTFFLAKQISWINGSNYNAFKVLLKAYVSDTFSKDSIFVFDGPLHEGKEATRVERNNSKIGYLSSVYSAALSQSGDNHAEKLAVSLLPPFATIIAMSVIKSLGYLVYCSVKVEADFLISALARHHSCPVLSNDSDFFIFNIPSFITLDSISLSTAREYKRDQLARLLQIPTSLFFILAVISGNDQVSNDELRDMYQSNPNLGLNGGKVNNASKKIKGIIKIIQSLGNTISPDLAIKAISNRFSKEWQGRISALLLVADFQYSNQGKLEDFLFHYSDTSMPLAMKVQDGLINPKLLEASKSKFYAIPFYPSNPLKPSPWDCSLIIRRKIYNTLQVDKVTEYYRSNEKMETRSFSSGINGNGNEELLKFGETALEMQIDNIHSAIVACLRLLIISHALQGLSLGNHLVHALLHSFLLSIEMYDGTFNSGGMEIPAAQPTSAAIGVFGQIETIALCFQLLLQLRGSDLDMSIILNCPFFFHCFEMVRRGGSIRHNNQFDTILAAVTIDLEPYLEIIV